MNYVHVHKTHLVVFVWKNPSSVFHMTICYTTKHIDVCFLIERLVKVVFSFYTFPFSITYQLVKVGLFISLSFYFSEIVEVNQYGNACKEILIHSTALHGRVQWAIVNPVTVNNLQCICTCTEDICSWL